jgi:hypothetical protein
MKTHNVKSSVISAVGYSRQNKQLAILFNSGYTYLYSGVSKRTFTSLRKADSVGKFFNENIVGQYEAQKVE